MKKTLIKICGITDPKTAQMSLQAGADFIGIVLTPCSSRYVNIDTAMPIAQAIRAEGVKPILVFKDESSDIIAQTAQKIGDCIIQFQAHEHKDIKQLMATFETIPVYSPAQKFAASLASGISPFISIDNPQPGSGRSFCWETFTPPTVPWILAGGLHAENVLEAISQLHPTGVDVSSGVEVVPGKKSFPKIKQFIQTIRGENFL
jgi:phosphoribosylanthranilate isomerase